MVVKQLSGLSSLSFGLLDKQVFKDMSRSSMRYLSHPNTADHAYEAKLCTTVDPSIKCHLYSLNAVTQP